MSIIVTHYGVHWATGDVAFLHQARGGTNAVGLMVKSPFEVAMRRKWYVNHLFGINAVNPARAHFDAFQVILERSSLARFMLPTPVNQPEPGVLYADRWDTLLPVLTCLMKMSCPIKLPLLWANLTTSKSVLQELEMTNVQPMILAGVEPSHIAWVRDIMRAAPQCPRKLLVVARPNVPFNIGTHLDAAELISRNPTDLLALPWETLGNVTLRAYMRHEWDGSWFTREPIPGNEAKVKQHG